MSGEEGKECGVRRRQGEKLINVCVQPDTGNNGLSVMVWDAIHHGGRVSWLWWMKPWTNIGTSRSWGIKCCYWRRGCLDVTFCTSMAMPHPIQHVTRQLFWANRMLMSWTGQLEVQTWTQLSMVGTTCQSGSETWMTPFHRSWAKQYCPPKSGLQFGQEGCRPLSRACLVVSGLFWRLEAGTHATSVGVRRAILCSTNM